MHLKQGNGHGKILSCFWSRHPVPNLPSSSSLLFPLSASSLSLFANKARRGGTKKEKFPFPNLPTALFTQNFSPALTSFSLKKLCRARKIVKRSVVARRLLSKIIGSVSVMEKVTGSLLLNWWSYIPLLPLGERKWIIISQNECLQLPFSSLFSYRGAIKGDSQSRKDVFSHKTDPKENRI